MDVRENYIETFCRATGVFFGGKIDGCTIYVTRCPNCGMTRCAGARMKPTRHMELTYETECEHKGID